MNDLKKTKQQLIDELEELRQRITALTALQQDLPRAEEDKKEADMYLENVFNTSVDGIIVTDADGTVSMVNQAVEDMFGYARDEIMGRNTMLLRPAGAEYEEKGLEFIATLLEAGVIRGIERTWQRRDGSPIEIEINAALLKDSAGKIIGAVGSIRDISERKWAEAKVLEYQNQLKSLASQLTYTEERERRSLATYLHDNIGQKLFVLKINCELVQKAGCPPAGADTLQNMNDMIQQLIDDTRSLTFELSPPILYQLGFEAALDWLFDQMHNQYGLKTKFADDKSPRTLDADTLAVLFRSVHELLINVSKHAQTQNVTVSLGRKGDYLHITVEDDGAGFPCAEVNTYHKGFGLFSIKERLEFIGGQCTIHSIPGQGTKVTLIAPLRDRKER
jgi:PAS domain S-box-containing protein